jgi:hypothetical protein
LYKEFRYRMPGWSVRPIRHLYPSGHAIVADAELRLRPRGRGEFPLDELRRSHGRKRLPARDAALLPHQQEQRKAARAAIDRPANVEPTAVLLQGAMLHRVGGQFMRRERQDVNPVIAEGESWDLIAQHQA